MAQGIETHIRTESPQVKTFRHTWTMALSVDNPNYQTIPTVSQIESMLQKHLGPSAILLRWAMVETILEETQRQWIIEGAYLTGSLTFSSSSSSTTELA